MGDDFLNQFSPWGVVTGGTSLSLGYNRTQNYYDILGVDTLDYLDLYRKHTFVRRESYKLDYIGQVELGEGKDAESVLTEMAYKLTNSLLHPTTLALREAAMHDDPALSRWLGQALSLSDTTSDIKK